ADPSPRCRPHGGGSRGAAAGRAAVAPPAVHLRRVRPPRRAATLRQPADRARRGGRAGRLGRAARRRPRADRPGRRLRGAPRPRLPAHADARPRGHRRRRGARRRRARAVQRGRVPVRGLFERRGRARPRRARRDALRRVRVQSGEPVAVAVAVVVQPRAAAV
ncbi:MAG: hypothetical protein AVDCRST_MAG11-1427, partial [uncultured Gemmatimonadaceae bacterium]